MKTSIWMKAVSLTEASGGKPNKNMRVYPDHINVKVMVSQLIVESSFWKAIKKVGFKNLLKIRKIKFHKAFKHGKYTVDAAAELMALHSINLEEELLKMMSEELNAYKNGVDDEYMNRHRDEIVRMSEKQFDTRGYPIKINKE
jgi:hypothetical protein